MKRLSHQPLYLRTSGGSVKFPLTVKKEKHNPKRGEKGRTLELQPGQSHLSVQQDHGADPFGSCAEVHGKYRGDL